MRLNRMLRQTLALAAALSMVTVWPAAPSFAADKAIDLDGNTANGSESTAALNVVSTSPTQIKNKVTNKAAVSRSASAGRARGGASSTRPAGQHGRRRRDLELADQPAGLLLNSDITFNQTARAPSSAGSRPAQPLPDSDGIHDVIRVLTSSLITFFSPGTEGARHKQHHADRGRTVQVRDRVKNSRTVRSSSMAAGAAQCSSEVCGDGGGRIEQCDGSDLNDASCEVFGGTGTLACGRVPVRPGGCLNVCGNRVREGDEQCDHNDVGVRPASAGVRLWLPGVRRRVRFRLQRLCPAECGNGIREGFEDCDGSDLAKETARSATPAGCWHAAPSAGSTPAATTLSAAAVSSRAARSATALGDQDCLAGVRVQDARVPGGCGAFDTSCTNLCIGGRPRLRPRAPSA
jgi:hypothetical protein